MAAAVMGPKPTAADVAACQFSSWYPTFRDMNADADAVDVFSALRERNVTAKKIRKSVTIESETIRPLPAEFLEYLGSDGVRLPECASRVSSCMDVGGGGNDDDGDGDGRWDESSEEEEEEGDSSAAKPNKYSFPALTEKIQSALSRLGGERNLGCMPKLSWSSPKDAAWMNCGTLKCTTAGDVYLLLKSSDFVGFDLEKAWDDLAPPHREGGEAEEGDIVGLLPPPGFEHELVLRKWCNLHPSMEFRCFVHGHELVAVSQRHPSKFYPHLQPPSDGSIHPSIIIVHAFFQTYIRERFADGKVGNYVVDVYLDSQERVWIVDFNVWGDRTDGLLFGWDELAELGKNAVVDAEDRGEEVADGGDDDDDQAIMPETRVVTKDMKSMTYDPLSSYRGPTDVMDILTGDGVGGDGDGGATPAFEEFMRQCVRPSEM